MEETKTTPRTFPRPRWKRWGWLVIELLLFLAVMSVTGGILFFVAGILGTLFGMTSKETLMGDWFMLISEAIMAIGSVVALYVTLRVSRRVSPAEQPRTGFALKGHARELGAGVGVATALYAVGFIVVLLLGGLRVTDIHVHVSALCRTWLFFFTVALFEETVCRGFLLGRMMDAGVNKFAALVLSSVLFSLLHLDNPSFAVLPFINLLLAGILLGSAYIYTRNLWFAIALHWFWNWLQGPVLGFEVSGNRLQGNLLTLETTDNALLNGGPFGFEGSLVCTVLMLAGIFLIIRYYERRKPSGPSAPLSQESTGM